MNTSVIISKKAGQVVPRAYLEAALKNCPTCYGMTVQDSDDDGSFLDGAAEARTIAVDDLHKKLEDLKDVGVTVWLGNMQQDFDKVDDLQPFAFQKAVEGQEPMDILHIYMEGDFPNYSKPGKGHTDEYNLWDDFIYPQMLKEYQAAQGDDDLFFSELRKSPFEQMVMHTVGHRAAVVMVPYIGEPIVFGQNDLGAEFDWGATSNSFKWGEQSNVGKAADAIVAVAKKTRGRLAGLMDSSSAVVVPAEARPDPTKHSTGNPPGVHNVADVNKAETHNSDPFSKWPGTSSKTHVMRTVPSGLQGNARNRWIRIFLGLGQQAELPKGKDAKDFMIPVLLKLDPYAQEDVTTNDEVRNLSDKVKSFQGSGDVSDAMKTSHATQHQVQRPDPKAAKAPAPEKKLTDARPTSDFLPEITADDKKASMTVIHDWATQTGRPKPLEIQKIEAKWPLATTTYGIKWDTDVSSWSIADIKLLAKKHPDVIALFFVEARLRANGAIVEQEVKPADKQVEVPPTKPEVAPPVDTPKPAGRKSRLATLTSAA